MIISVLNSIEHLQLNTDIGTKITEGFIPYGIPFAIKNHLCQLMYCDDDIKAWNGEKITYQILPRETAPPLNYTKGAIIIFNCQEYVTYMNWPATHFKKYLQTILCLKAMIPV